ncbi:hypothetical protein ACLKA6_013743 [Drosophila palustris]
MSKTFEAANVNKMYLDRNATTSNVRSVEQAAKETSTTVAAIVRKCYNCGGPFTPTHLRVCKANGVTCNACGRVEHFSQWCKQQDNKDGQPHGKSTICDWYSNFKRGRTSTEDSKSSGRPKEVIIPEIIRQVRQIVLTDRRVKVREIAETVGISTGSAVSILHDHLHMKKLNVKWVPHFLDIVQKKKRVADSKSCLDMFNRNPSEFLRRHITMDETWIHHYIPESNRSSAEWQEAGESRSKRVKATRWAGKVFASVFWDGHGNKE